MPVSPPPSWRPGKLRRVTFASRLVPLAETAGVAFVLFGTAGELSGPVAGALLLQVPLLVPRPYLDGISYLAVNDTGGSAAYIAGIAYAGGRWWYWPLSVVIKWPGTALLLLVAGVTGCLRLRPGLRRRAGLAVALPAALIAGFTLAMPKDVGVRYLLPVLALWAAAAASGLVTVLGAAPGRGRKRLAGLTVAVLLGAAVVSTAGSFPRSIAWTAWPFRPGYALVTDSNVDWGQGLYALRSWSASRDPRVAYFGPRGITTADIPGARPLLGAAPARVDGWAAVSVTALNSANRPSLSWLRAWCPAGILDGTILICHFSRPPASTSARRPAPRPAQLCPGRWSSAR